MTETQMLVLVGTIYIAPHCDMRLGVVVCSINLFVAAFKGLGWI